jgi:uncharacterized protein YukE
MSFQHPALAQAADSGEVRLLSQAANTLGAPDPLQAMQFVDCDPAGVTKQVAQLDRATQQLTDAAERFSSVIARIDAGWSGGDGHAAFTEAAADLTKGYAATAHRTQEGVDLGKEVASTLDSVATTVGHQATAIADGAIEASQRVLAGEQDAAAEEVNKACRDILLVVQENLRIVGELADHMKSKV